MRSVRLADGRKLCVRRWRDGSDPVVVLHGLLDSSEGWAHLCERVEVPGVAFDLPGFGQSDAAPQGSISGYGADIAEALETLEIDRFTLLGHSLGGAVATALVELMPSRVSSLVLLAPAGFGRIHLAEAASIPGLRNVLQATLPVVLSSRRAVTTGYVRMVANGHSPNDDVVDRVITRGRELVVGAREGTRAVVEAGRRRDAFYRRRIDYDGPVFAIWGDRDRLVPVAHRHGVKHAFPQADVQVWYGMGHHPLNERPEDLLALVAKAASTRRASRRRSVRPVVAVRGRERAG